MTAAIERARAHLTAIRSRSAIADVHHNMLLSELLEIVADHQVEIAQLRGQIKKLEQPRSAIRADFFPSEQPAGDSPNQPECPVCVTRREWAIGAKL